MSSFLNVWNLIIIFHLESQEQFNERMIMKCTNLIQQDNKNSDDDNQDSTKRKKNK